ncbi:DNA polymerase-3 subunit alpha [Natronocella acetinitrilica]|uniref:DNA polymerase III subunit alpha n=1 Tax=Natronocella acetinitrilica TaxID=414046 RepID=A0AAE3G364_9GAMM|nr:DNA polymerase III subunit alpha [Natronocella acetinitrilica]MCP1674204.1 DNA polymerase-3 subunit alpha [Natronocella acetinitrilica]
MPASQFVHLGVHTEYSLSDSLVRIPALLEAVRERGMAAVAMTDAANLFAMVRFYRQAIKAGVKPIVGAEIDLTGASGNGMLTLLCQNMQGYRNLTRLISQGYTEGRASDDALPLYNEEWLDTHGAGLIALSGGRRGQIGRALLGGETALAAELARAFALRFPGRFYIELQRTGHPKDERYNQGALELAYACELPVVATNAVRFLDPGDYATHEVRESIAAGTPVARLQVEETARSTPHQSLKTPREMAELFSDVPEAIANTLAIAERCSLDIEFGANYLPQFPVPAGMDEAGFLAESARQGLEARLDLLYERNAADFHETRKAYDERLAYELGVINDMGFPGYFLIVADFIQWAKDNGVPVGPGRGSGAGSLVAYSLNITDLDPLRYDLLFERFLNPERISMPDFDVDFCMEGRDRVIRYVAEKYGQKAVSQIITFGTMAARMVVRDVARSLGHPYMFGDRVAKLIPDELGISLERAMETAPELAHLYEVDGDVREVIDHARKLEGLTRQVGKHAGGVLIAPGELTDHTPLYCDADGSGLLSQFDKDDVETAGLVKFDFLGLRNLTIIKWALDAINANRKASGEAALDILTIDMEDPETFALLKRQETIAVFQLESQGMRNLIKRLQPDTFEDIIALVALFRPGPLQSGMVDDFINRKKGLAEIAYPHPLLEPILANTYGVFVYQEQVMQCAQTLAGYTLGQADNLRKAMGKKIASEMEKQRSKFIDGAVGNGIERDTATRIFELMEKFAAYGFNKSHSAAYALIACQTAFLKAHYPAEYMAAVLSSEVAHIEKLVGFLDETRGMGLAIRPPCVNRSGAYFRALDGTDILYGLEAVKGIGEKAVARIIGERERGGPYRDLFDFCLRCNPNKRELEAAIRAGALDAFGQERSVLLASYPEIQAAARKQAKSAPASQDLFGDAPPGSVVRYREAAPLTIEERLAGERASLGVFLSGHPIDSHRAELSQIITGSIAECLGRSLDGDAAASRQSRPVKVAGIITDLRVLNAKGGKRAVITLDDGSARTEVSVFQNTFAEYGHLIAQDAIVVVDGALRYNRRREAMEISASRLLDINGLREQLNCRLTLEIDSRTIGPGVLQDLKGLLLAHERGNSPIEVNYHRADGALRLMLGDDYNTAISEPLLRDLRDLLGTDAVTLDYGTEAPERPAPKAAAAASREEAAAEGERTRADRHARISRLLDEAAAALGV